MRISNVVITNFGDIDLPVTNEIFTKYRGNTVRISKKHFTGFCTKNIKKIFGELNTAWDFSRFLSWVLEEPVIVQVKLCSMVCVQNTPSNCSGVEVQNFVKKVFAIGGKNRWIEVKQGNLGYDLVFTDSILNKPLDSSICALQFKTNNDKVHIKIQFSALRKNFYKQAIVSDFGEKTLQILDLMEHGDQ